MKTIKLNLGNRSYNIIIGRKVLKNAGRLIRRLNIGRDAYIITNQLVKDKYARTLARTLKRHKINFRIKTVADSEKSKSLKSALSIIKDITFYDKNKKVFIIALGGGVIGDLAGFVASIYKRGIPYIQVPTTLLAQIDSSIGGKTAVDLSEAKNLVGAFYQPRLVLSDTACLKTLSIRQVRSGLAEAIKYSIIKDKKLFDYIKKNRQKLLSLEEKSLEYLVYSCSKIKAGIVQQDEKEKRQIRTILNFGHTIGHAIEAACGFRSYTHGEAVAIGMICAADISMRLKLINKAVFEKIILLIRAIGLPEKIRNISVAKIIKAHYRDKKFLGRENKFILIKGLGHTVVKKNIALSLIKAVILSRI